MRIPALIFGSFFVPIGLLYVATLFSIHSGLSWYWQLVWLVSASENPLDYAYNWFW
jgi:hypothetical protein